MTWVTEKTEYAAVKRIIKGFPSAQPFKINRFLNMLKNARIPGKPFVGFKNKFRLVFGLTQQNPL